MICKHYFYFGERLASKLEGNYLNEDNWELLRNDEEEGPFSIERTKEKYEENCKKAISYKEAANIIVNYLQEKDLTKKTIVSLGSGKGVLEWHIKQINPQLTVSCTDYTKEAIAALKNVFPSVDEAYPFDILNDDYSKIGADSTIIIYRVSTEFNRQQWIDIMSKMYNSGIERIIYVPVRVETFLSMSLEKMRYIINVLRGRKPTFCGWLYSESELNKMFKDYNVVEKTDFDNTTIYFLER